MAETYYVLMNASGVTSNEKVATWFRGFRTIQEAESLLWDWLEFFLDVRCVPEDQADRLRSEHGGYLPEDVFLCPRVDTPEELTKYNDFYDLGGLGRIFNILLSPIYDAETARQVCLDIDRDYGISGRSSAQGREMKAHLDGFLRAWEKGEPVDEEDFGALSAFVERGGFSILDREAVPDTVVLTGEKPTEL